MLTVLGHGCSDVNKDCRHKAKAKVKDSSFKDKDKDIPVMTMDSKLNKYIYIFQNAMKIGELKRICI